MGRFFLFLLALFPLFGGLALSTQNFAKLVHYDARFLGSPLLDLTRKGIPNQLLSSATYRKEGRLASALSSVCVARSATGVYNKCSISCAFFRRFP